MQILIYESEAYSLFTPKGFPWDNFMQLVKENNV